MTKDVIIMALGAWVLVLPFLGFPSRFDTLLFVLSGLLIITMGVLVRREQFSRRTPPETPEPQLYKERDPSPHTPPAAEPEPTPSPIQPSAGTSAESTKATASPTTHTPKSAVKRARKTTARRKRATKRTDASSPETEEAYAEVK